MATMDEDDTELIAMLATRIGTIMEDASIIALTAGRMDTEQRAVALGEVELAAEKIGALAAATLDDHGSHPGHVIRAEEYGKCAVPFTCSKGLLFTRSVMQLN